MRAALLGVGLILALTRSEALPAQATGTIVGSVVDDLTGATLSGATISVWRTDIDTVSDTGGAFALEAVPAGGPSIRVELTGYAAVVERMEILPEEVVLVQFRLTPLAAALEGLLVRVRPDEGGGATVSSVEPGGAYALTALDLLRQQVPGVSVRALGASGPGIRIRGSSSLYENDPVLFVDGVLAADGITRSVVEALEQIPAESVLRVRVLHGPAATARFGDASSGVILLETR